ncbi:hypothetical protein [Bacillus sp. JJ1562]|uniref:hypothetical protein n=1 Tax=Bacillus sp. JJ1562 TaxID=3122960 RepID=UPI0030030AAA
MSISFKYICVLKENVFEIPKNKIEDRKITIEELAGQDVIRLEICYEIKNKKPNSILRVLFERFTFDGNGVCNFRITREEIKRNYDYIFSVESPLPLPKSPVLPNELETKAIKHYLNRKYPALLKNDPYAIEVAILNCKEKYKQNVNNFKKSHQPVQNKGI